MSTEYAGVTALASQLVMLCRRELSGIGLASSDLPSKSPGVCAVAGFTALDVYMHRIQGLPDPELPVWPFTDPPRFSTDRIHVLVSALGFLMCELEANLIAQGKTQPMSLEAMVLIELDRKRARGHG